MLRYQTTQQGSSTTLSREVPTFATLGCQTQKFVMCCIYLPGRLRLLVKHGQEGEEYLLCHGLRTFAAFAVYLSSRFCPACKGDFIIL